MLQTKKMYVCMYMYMSVFFFDFFFITSHSIHPRRKELGETTLTVRFFSMKTIAKDNGDGDDEGDGDNEGEGDGADVEWLFKNPPDAPIITSTTMATHEKNRQ